MLAMKIDERYAKGPTQVMILGCGRSGTSIFGELFDGLAGYTYLSEPSFDDVLASDFKRPHAFKVPRESPRYEAAPGLSFPIAVFLEKAPNTRFFWMVRHPLDAICSLRVGIDNSWGHHPRPPDWQSWQHEPLLKRCAHHWAFLNSAGFKQVEKDAVVVHFESMLNDPRSLAVAACTTIGVEPASQAEPISRWARRVQNTNNADFVEAQTSRNYSRADHQVRIGRWRENLSAADVDTVWPIVHDSAKQFGYGLATER
jgi:hypothetical protein